jgi:NAD(P)-dependent dehydrogenase (short-subunit alcohol dehydrogenase family)
MGSRSSRSNPRFQLTAQDVVNECARGRILNNLRILVTGASSGIGTETSRVLAVNGAKVYMMGRDEAKLQEVINGVNNELQQQQRPSGGSVEGVICDLDSLASIKQFAQKFLQENSFLNILILNAGVYNYKFAQTVDGLEQVMGVNHFGHAYLTQLLMPLLVASAPSRIVVLSSKLHAGPPLDYEAFDRMSSKTKNAQKGWGTLSSYQQSKLANLLFARALAFRYKDKRVTVYSLHPGVINTNSIAEGAATTVYCALKPGLESETGRYFDNSAVTDLADKWDDAEINQFWNWTERVIQERTANL